MMTLLVDQRSLAVWLAVHAVLTLWACGALGQQQADPEFDAKVASPTYADNGPRVLFDKAHHNFHTANGRYKPFADLITNDGYRVTPNTDKFTPEKLAGCDILVIANALGAQSMSSEAAQDPAFTEAECDAVRDWVRSGGSLLLVTDHYPTGSAAEILGQRFGVQMSKGGTAEFQFTRGGTYALAAEHPIMGGRSAEEEIRKVMTFSGQSLQGPPDSVNLLALPADAKERTPDPQDPHHGKPREGTVVYRSQGLALTLGKGRVVVLGEAAMFSAQVADDEQFGMNVPGIDNRQLALNTMHWLSGLLNDGK